MAAVVVQSRFAGLKIEDDDISPNETQKSKKNKTNTAKKIEPAKNIEPAKKTKNTNNNKSQVGTSFKILHFHVLLSKVFYIYFINFWLITNI